MYYNNQQSKIQSLTNIEISVITYQYLLSNLTFSAVNFL